MFYYWISAWGYRKIIALLIGGSKRKPLLVRRKRAGKIEDGGEAKFFGRKENPEGKSIS